MYVNTDVLVMLFLNDTEVLVGACFDFVLKYQFLMPNTIFFLFVALWGASSCKFFSGTRRKMMQN